MPKYLLSLEDADLLATLVHREIGNLEAVHVPLNENVQKDLERLRKIETELRAELD